MGSQNRSRILMKSKILILVLTFFVSACNPVYSDANSLLIEEFDMSKLKLAISSNDVSTTLSQLSLAKQEQYRGDVNEYIMGLWEQSASSEFDVLRNELVSINIADFLSQAHRNKFVTALPDSVIDAARDGVKSSNRKVISRSLAILSRSSDKQDVESILGLIEETESDYLFESAAMSVISACEPQLIERLIDSDKLSNSQKNYITSSNTDFNEAGLCAYKNNSGS